MEKQIYENHIRWYKPHHFVLYPFLFILGCSVIFFLARDKEHTLLWMFAGITIILFAAVTLMMRQHYSLINQNRIVRLELRFRYYVLTQKRFEEVEARLSRGQIHALRFAPDEEFPQLVERALKENLSADAIKRAIKNWLPDEMRV